MSVKTPVLQDVKSSVIAVTVYESKAQVHRSAKAKLAKGDTTLIFDDIPINSIDRDSVQVLLRAVDKSVDPGACLLNGIVFDTIEREIVDSSAEKEKATAAQVAEWEKELATLKVKLDQMRVDQQMMVEESSMVSDYFSSAVAARSNESPDAFVDVNMWKAIVEQKIASDQGLFTKTKQYEKDAAAVSEKINSLTQQIKKAGGPTVRGTRSVKVVKVHLECKTDVGEMEVLMSYMVTNAAWSAAYDVRVDPSRGTANITYHAVVRQWTEEDWDDVAVTISTAKPAVSGRAPDLNPWYARVTASGVTPTTRNRVRSSSQASSKVLTENLDFYDDEECDDFTPASQTPPIPMVADGAEVRGETAGSSISYDVLHKHSVPRTNDPIRMTLAVIDLTPEVNYTCRPSMAEVVFANLSTINPSNYLMMPGDANVFVDGQFVTKTTLARTAPKAAIKVGLGSENGISVKYKHLREHNSESGGLLQTKKSKREYNRQFSLKNLKDVPVTIRVEHEVPTAEDTRIEVSILEPAGIPANDIKDGRMIINVALKPREEKKVNVSLAVSYPTDMVVEGL